MKDHSWDRGDGFIQTSGSSQWPSDDDEDSPYDTFACTVCEHQFDAQMYGMRHKGEESFESMVSRRIQAHIMTHMLALLKKEVL